MHYLQKEYGTTYFAFVDDIFTQKPARLKKLCELMAKSFRPRENLFWYCEARVDSLAKNPELVPMMREAGLTRIQIGTESGSQQVIDAYKKAITLDQIRTAVDQCNAAGVLSVFTNFIIGGALETEQTFQQTLDLAKELLRRAPGRLECNTTFLSPYPMTDIQRNPGSYGVRVLDPEFETGLSDDHIFAETKDVSKPRILELARAFRQEMALEMFNIVPTMPADLMLEHLRLNDHCLQTQWSDLLRADEIIRGWSRHLRASGVYQTRIDACGDADGAMPQRTFSMRRCKNGALDWPYRRRQIEFDEYELFLVEHCAGKLTVTEIIDRAFDYWKGTVNRDELRRDLIPYLQSLADELLLVFRQFHWGPVSVGDEPRDGDQQRRNKDLAGRTTELCDPVGAWSRRPSESGASLTKGLTLLE
jgi:hypothetical protein